MTLSDVRGLTTQLPDQTALGHWMDSGDQRLTAEELVVLSMLFASRVSVSCSRIASLARGAVAQSGETAESASGAITSWGRDATATTATRDTLGTHSGHTP